MPVRFMKTEPHHCRYFMPGESGMDGLVCGEPTKDGKSFCAHHHRETHQPFKHKNKHDPRHDRSVEYGAVPDDHEPDLTEIIA